MTARYGPSERVVSVSSFVEVPHAGAVLLAATAGPVGLDRELSAALRPWRRPLAIQYPGKMLLDLPILAAIGGDCLADIAQVRSESALFGRGGIGSDSVQVDRHPGRGRTPGLGRDQHGSSDDSGQGVGTGRSRCTDHQVTVKAPLIVDLDAALITAHSEKQLAAATFKRSFGHHPIGAWADHGDGGTVSPSR